MRRTSWALVLLCAAAAATGCSQGASPPGAGAASPAPVRIDGGGVDDRAPVAGTEGLTKAQLLDRSLSYEGARGVVAGEVRSAGVPAELPPRGQGDVNTRAVVHYDFLVTGVHGAAVAPYRIGSTITIRVPAPGPSPDNDVPAFAKGQRLLVWATDQPATGLLGASSESVLPLPDATYVAVVDGGTVRWLGYEEPLPVFLAHFSAHPVA